MPSPGADRMLRLRHLIQRSCDQEGPQPGVPLRTPALATRPIARDRLHLRPVLRATSRAETKVANGYRSGQRHNLVPKTTLDCPPSTPKTACSRVANQRRLEPLRVGAKRTFCLTARWTPPGRSGPDRRPWRSSYSFRTCYIYDALNRLNGLSSPRSREASPP